jgi:hypothetical protein
MPALNMGSPASPAANPSTGQFILMSPFSGPKGSPFDAKYYHPTTFVLTADPNNFSTGGLSTGIGFGGNHIIGPTAPASIVAAGFTDDYQPGLSYMTSATSLQTASTAILSCIGGGKSSIVSGTGPATPGNPTGNGTPTSEKVSVPAPYVAQPLLGFGDGGARDAGAGPAFTGFGAKMVTATAATVAVGAAVETGWINRSDRIMVIAESVFGSAVAASPAVT